MDSQVWRGGARYRDLPLIFFFFFQQKRTSGEVKGVHRVAQANQSGARNRSTTVSEPDERRVKIAHARATLWQQR